MQRTLLPTVDILFSVVTGEYVDDMGQTKFIYDELLVPGCLVRTGVPSELSGGLRVHQENKITVHFPSAFTDEFMNAEFNLYGKRFRMETVQLPITSSPLRWNRSGEASIVGSASTGG